MAENNPSNLGGESYEIIIDGNSLQSELTGFPDWVHDAKVMTSNPSKLTEAQIQRLDQVGEPLDLSHRAGHGIITQYNGRLRVPVTVSVPKNNPRNAERNEDPGSNSRVEMWTHTFPASYPILISIGTEGLRRVNITALKSANLHKHVNTMMNGSNPYLQGSSSSTGGKRRKGKKTKRRNHKKRVSRRR